MKRRKNMIFNKDIVTKEITKILRKNQNKPAGQIVLQIRTLFSAIHIAEVLDGIPFEQISYQLYLHAKDVKMEKLIRLFDPYIEMAAVMPSRFIRELHPFYMKIRKTIINDWNNLCIFMQVCCENNILRIHNGDPTPQTPRECVLCAYQDILGQLYHYLLPNINNQHLLLVGRRENGEMIEVPDVSPYIDCETVFELMGRLPIVEPLRRLSKPYGYQKLSEDEMLMRINSSNITGNAATFMIPLINDETEEFIFKTPIGGQITKEMFVDKTMYLDNLQDLLVKRNRLLPSQGIEFICEGKTDYFMKSLFLKEIIFNGSLYLMFRVESTEGDITGYYKPENKCLFSPFSFVINEDVQYFLSNIHSLILMVYASIVKKECYGIADILSYNGTPIYLTRKQQANKNQPGEKSRSFDASKYKYESRFINGFVRKLPDGQIASERARQYAEMIGLELEDGYTYVHPFSKSVLKLKD